jgi:peptide/nickel transport system ATP-binding protein
MAPIIEIVKLSISFPNTSKRALNNLSLSVEIGDTIGIVGESGSGKSITGLAIMGLLPVGTNINGKIWIKDCWLNNQNNGNRGDYEAKKGYVDLLSVPSNKKSIIRGNRIAMIFQEPMTSLNPSMKCGKQVEESLILHSGLKQNERADKVISLFNEVLLPSPELIFKKYPHQLSGGQRQRVMIAMALACSPELLIADEPTTALDVTIQKEILELLQVLKVNRKLSMIFISHDLNVIEKVADKVLVLRNGEMEEYGNAKQIINNPENPYTKGLIACKPKAGVRLSRLPVVEDFLNNTQLDNTLISNSIRKKSHDRIYQNDPLLVIKNLTSWYSIGSNNFFTRKRQSNILQGININVWKGETLGLVGESGSGKTTLGRTIIQLIDTFSGDILFEGKPVKEFNRVDKKRFRQKVQLVFQDPYSSLSPYQTIGMSILEPMNVHALYENKAKRLEKVYELMKLTRIDAEWFNRYPHQLSGGQRQRVVIARALALNPEILICDESVSALDVSIQAQILNLLNDLKEKLNLTYIFISHDLSVVRYMSDRIIVLKAGEIVEQAEADELCTHPENDYTKRLLNSAFIG